MSDTKTRKPPRRIRQVVSITIHPKILGWLDQRAGDLEISRSKMIERLVNQHCREDWIGPEAIDVRVSYQPGEGLKLHKPRKRPAL